MANKLSDQQQGMLSITAGAVILLLYSMGVIQRFLGLLVVVGGLLFIYYGMKLAGYDQYLMRLFKKEKRAVKKKIKAKQASKK